MLLLPLKYNKSYISKGGGSKLLLPPFFLSIKKLKIKINKGNEMLNNTLSINDLLITDIVTLYADAIAVLSTSIDSVLSDISGTTLNS